MLAKGHISAWNGTAGRVEISTGISKPGPASRGEPANFSPMGTMPGTYFIGSPAMSSLADGILQEAQKDVRSNMTLKPQYGTLVASMEPHLGPARVEGWTLRNRSGGSLGEYDWLVVTSLGIAHPRWEEVFAEPAPLIRAMQDGKLPELSAAINDLSQITSEGVHVAMLAWEKASDKSRVTDVLLKLPFDATEVEGDHVLAKVVRQ